MNDVKFTNKYKNVLKKAVEIAYRTNSREVLPEHLMEALTKVKGSIAFELLYKLDLTDMDKWGDVKSIDKNKKIDIDSFDDMDDIVLSDEAKDVIQKSVLIAAKYEHKYIGTEHLLLGLISFSEDVVKDFLSKKKVDLNNLSMQVEVAINSVGKFDEIVGQDNYDSSKSEAVQSKPKSKAKKKKSKNQELILDYVGVELTDPYLQKKLNPVVGRDKEIERVIQILSRKDKNNPVLLGEPGVGKTAIVEGLARKIVEGDVPEVLIGKKIYNLDLSLLVAGAMYRGEFESRLKQVIEEVMENENIILFIDELHNIVGAGSAMGSLDAANILKPALARGEIRMIGATTFEEYKKHIETDSALDRRLQAVVVEEPSVSEAVKILKGIKSSYEEHHKIKITNDAIETAVKLSDRYISNKFLPDKAVDLIDEAGARISIQKLSKKSVSYRKRAQKLEEKLDKIIEDKRKAVQQENFPKALMLKEEERKIRAEIDAYLTYADDNKKFAGKITSKDISSLVAQITGIPVGELVESDIAKLKDLDKSLKSRIVGQDEAIDELVKVIKKSRTGLSNPNRPIGTFMFLGPSGVGKTETTKVLAEEVFNNAKSLVRFDMSEFSEGFNVSKLIGAPAGYVGYQEGGQLTDKIRRQPYSVVLFDEIEKAHPEVFNILLQILDDGRLTDSKGKEADFRNTIIVLTSNIGLTEFRNMTKIGFGGDDSKETDIDKNFKIIKSDIMNQLRKEFKLEFLNRLDKIVVFKPLDRKSIEKIVQIELGKISNQLLKENNIRLDISRNVYKFISDRSYSPDEGARLVKRNIQDYIVSPLADEIIDGSIKRNDSVSIKAGKSKIVFAKK